MDRSISAENFKIEAVPIESNHVREGLELSHQFLSVFFKPPPEGAVFVPRDCNSYSERADVGPAAVHLVRQPQRFNVQVYLAIE